MSEKRAWSDVLPDHALFPKVQCSPARKFFSGFLKGRSPRRAGAPARTGKPEGGALAYALLNVTNTIGLRFVVSCK